MGTAPRKPLRTRLAWVGARLGIGLAVLLALRVSAYAVGKEDARAILDDRAESSLVARRDYVESRLDELASEAAPSGQFGGEWRLVTLSMLAVGATNLAFTYPDTVPRARTIVDRCLELALAKENRAFDTDRWGEDALEGLSGAKPHLGYLGHLALILEAKRVLGGGVDANEEPVLAALRRRVGAGPSPVLETYPDERYVADNVVVWAAIAMSGIEHGGGERTARVAPIVAKAKSWMETKLLDPATDGLVFRTDAAGVGQGPARGSGLAWSGIYLPFIDRALAKREATALRDHFRKSLGPFGGGVCEYAECAIGAGDVDSGPLVRGISPAATGFGLAAARTLGDERWLDDLLSTAEWVGVTIPGARRRFALGPLVGDAIVVAALSTRAGEVVWDGRYLSR